MCICMYVTHGSIFVDQQMLQLLFSMCVMQFVSGNVQHVHVCHAMLNAEIDRLTS